MVAVVGFVSIVAFARNEDFFVPVLLTYFLALLVFVVVAEVSQVRYEEAPRTELSAPSGEAYRTPLPH
jgi:hypothetical protein